VATAAASSAIPLAHAHESVVCEQLVEHNLNEVVHGLAREYHAPIPATVCYVFRQVRTECPEISWRLPKQAPHNDSTETPPPDHEFCGNDPRGFIA
jgi:hypothetical protein